MGVADGQPHTGRDLLVATQAARTSTNSREVTTPNNFRTKINASSICAPESSLLHHFWNYNIDVSFQLFSSKRPIKIFESCDGPHPPLGWGTASWLWKPSEPVETVIRVVAASTDFSARPNYNGPSGLFVIYKIEREPRVYGWMDGWGYKKCYFNVLHIFWVWIICITILTGCHQDSYGFQSLMSSWGLGSCILNL